MAYTPKALEYIEPTLVAPTATLPALPKAETYVNPKLATVEGRTTNLLKADNELLQTARAASNSAYNDRGLLNSGGGVMAGTGAVIGKALEIATPDAALYGNMALNTQRSTEDAALNNQLAQIEKAKSQNNARISGRLTELDQQGQQELQKLTGSQQSDLQVLTGNQQMNLQKQTDAAQLLRQNDEQQSQLQLQTLSGTQQLNLQKQTDAAQLQRLNIENQWKSDINMDQMDAEEAKALMGVAATLGAELTGGIERILRDPNITKKTSATTALMTQYKTQLSTSAAIVGIKLKWS